MSFAGLALAGLALILVGNGTGGGSLNQEFLPNGFRSLGQAFPNGPFIRTVRDTVYFHHHNIGQALVVVAAWAVGGLLLVLAGEMLPGFMSRSKKKAAAEPSV
jgi:hypothetical protein